MNHTPQIKKAIQFAARKHHGQFRKETEQLPYITHPFSVALLVAEGGGDDDMVVAALLHDTIEDTGTTAEEISQLFGSRVAELVESVSEKEGKDTSWQIRKDGYLLHLSSAPDEALLIAIADKIDNIESKLEAFEKEGEDIFSRWSQPSEKYLWYHGSVVELALKRLPEHPLTKRLAEVHARERVTFARP